jgi:hypothetical protein
MQSSEAAPCPLQPCYFDKWDIFADTSDCQYAMGFPVCILDNFLPILAISYHLLMSGRFWNHCMMTPATAFNNAVGDFKVVHVIGYCNLDQN